MLKNMREKFVKRLGVFLGLAEMSDFYTLVHLSVILRNAVTGPDQMSCGMFLHLQHGVTLKLPDA